MGDNNTSYSTVPVIPLLGVAFIVLKLCHVINWSWWWVTLPFWGGLAFLSVIGLVIFGGVFIDTYIKHRKGMNNIAALRRKASAELNKRK